MNMAEVIPPDLQATLACEDVRTEISGQQTLVGVFGMIPAHTVPIGFFQILPLDAMVRRHRRVYSRNRLSLRATTNKPSPKAN